MSGLKKILIVVCCVLLLAVGWLAAIFSKTDADRQEELLAAILQELRTQNQLMTEEPAD